MPYEASPTHGRASAPGSAGDDLPLDDLGPDDVGLPTFVVLARFAEAADSAEQAERSVRERLTATRGLFDDVAVERREDDGTWLLEVRFVVVSLDPQTAVTGVCETLAAARLSPDEVWVPLEPEPEPEPA